MHAAFRKTEVPSCDVRLAAIIHSLSIWPWSTEKLRLPGYISVARLGLFKSHAGSAGQRPLPVSVVAHTLRCHVQSQETLKNKVRTIVHLTVPRTKCNGGGGYPLMVGWTII